MNCKRAQSTSERRGTIASLSRLYCGSNAPTTVRATSLARQQEQEHAHSGDHAETRVEEICVGHGPAFPEDRHGRAIDVPPPRCRKAQPNLTPLRADSVRIRDCLLPSQGKVESDPSAYYSAISADSRGRPGDFQTHALKNIELIGESASDVPAVSGVSGIENSLPWPRTSHNLPTTSTPHPPPSKPAHRASSRTSSFFFARLLRDWNPERHHHTEHQPLRRCDRLLMPDGTQADGVAAIDQPVPDKRIKLLEPRIHLTRLRHVDRCRKCLHLIWRDCRLHPAATLRSSRPFVISFGS